MTDDQKQLAIALRADGLPYIKIAAKVGCSESGAYKFLSSLSKPAAPKPEPIPKKPNRKSPSTDLLPPHEFHGSCPTRRRNFNPAQLDNAPQLTKSEMYYDLARAVRNTARLAQR
jgi:hypothetical protein